MPLRELPKASANVTAPNRRAIQRRPMRAERLSSDQAQPSKESVAKIAQSGMQSPSSPLPFMGQLESAFKPHDISGIQAHMGSAAKKSAEGLNSAAFAANEHIVFGRQPDLFTAAHEVAHVVDQRRRPAPKSGNGLSQPKDSGEQLADSAAWRAARGESAASLLGPPRPSVMSSGSSVDLIQRMFVQPAQVEVKEKGSTPQLEQILDLWRARSYDSTKLSPSEKLQLRRIMASGDYVLRDQNEHQHLLSELAQDDAHVEAEPTPEAMPSAPIVSTVVEQQEQAQLPVPTDQESELAEPLRSMGVAKSDRQVTLLESSGSHSPKAAKLLQDVVVDVVDLNDEDHPVSTRLLANTVYPILPLEEDNDYVLRIGGIHEYKQARVPKARCDTMDQHALKKDTKLGIIKKMGDDFLVSFTVSYGVDPEDQTQVKFVGGYARVPIADVGGIVDVQTAISTLKDDKNPMKGKILPTEDKDPPISQKDVFQAGLSDCYLQSALIALVESQPDVIMDMFQAVDENTVDVCFEGKSSKRVRVSRSLLMDHDGNLLYGGKTDRYLWPAFIQKAYAVIRGSYAQVAFGKANDVFEATLGQGGYFDFSSARTPASALKLYRNVDNLLKKNLPATLATTTFAKHKKFYEKGQPEYRVPEAARKVRPIHGYAVLGIQEFKVSNPFSKFPQYQLQLRDPRDPEGEVFTRTIEDIITGGKFIYLFAGDAII